MGWFWADSNVSVVNAKAASPHPHANAFPSNAQPPPGCPMHKSSASTTAAPQAKPKSPSAETACPYTPADQPLPNKGSSSKYSKYNPLNYMFSDLSQDRAPTQTMALPTEREPSTIPKATGEGNWEYPSPQQMYHALLRKGNPESDIENVESMVSIHNFLNEGAWAEIVEWERRFSGGLVKGWQSCKRGEEGSLAGSKLEVGVNEDVVSQPKLIRFQGRPREITPKAAMIQIMGKIYPSAFATEPPFDRHDWYVQREHNGKTEEVRYVIDYYSAPPEPTGEPVFFLDVRPALTPTAAVERMMRWSGDVWYRASGAQVRETQSN